GVTLVLTDARHVDPHTVEVDGRRLEVEYVVVATGSTPSVPPIPGIDDVDVKTSADVLEMRSFPDRAIVIGLGYIGLELVPYLAEVGGSEVIAIDRNERPLSAADPVFGDTIVELYRDAFDAELLMNAEATEVGSTTNGIELTVEVDGTEHRVTGDQLFVFAGRTPSLDDVGLDALGIDARRPLVDATLRTEAHPHILVVGDANGREPVLHVAKEEGIAAARNIERAESGRSPMRYEPTVHRIVFSGLAIYPYARLGHTRTSAQRHGIEPLVVTREASDDGVFKTKGVPEGLASLVVDADDGRIIGYQGLHHHADVFAKTLQVIIETGLRVDEVPDRAYHPTTPELLDGLVRAAKDALATR
ncbi:MAG: FAD-dependent oxidoreductase, partial [Halobacteriota archaeon]